MSAAFLRRSPMHSEAAQRADFSGIRYAQCWEDADVLLEALGPGPGKRCLSIASAGDNALALLARAPQRVLAVDLSPAQLACLELRVAAYRWLEHPDLLALIGSRPSDRRLRLYDACRSHLSLACLAFWDDRRALLEQGLASAGKFERYFAVFRTRVLPLIHGRSRVLALFEPRSQHERLTFYDKQWSNLRWTLLFRIFFSRRVMGTLGRDPEFFRYVKGSVAERILARTRYAMTMLAPSENPYLRWIMLGAHGDSLPFALREENFEPIRRHLDALEWRCCALEQVLDGAEKFDCFNLSDIFEYMSPQAYEDLLRLIVASSRPAARLAYWNMLAPRSRPQSMAAMLDPLADLSASLFRRDKAFFYSALVVEQVR
jgi:S-adenosylmethionine-diacylglycerol 3-amino-3-carboxypropyl transferase